jgi:hypothetical protein
MHCHGILLGVKLLLIVELEAGGFPVKKIFFH